MLFDFGKVLGLEANGDLHDSAVHAHRIFENKHSSILHAFAFNPELCFMCQDPAHMDSMDVVKDADVVVIDGTRIENKYTLATRLESTCKPGSLMVLFHMELPGPQFETLHRVNVSSLSSSDIAGQDEASFSVIVQRRAADSKTAQQVGKREDGAKDRGSSFSEDDFDVASSTGSLPKRLLRNEALAHVSSPVGSQLMKVKHGRQIGHSNLGASATGSQYGMIHGETPPSSPHDAALVQRKRIHVNRGPSLLAASASEEDPPATVRSLQLDDPLSSSPVGQALLDRKFRKKKPGLRVRSDISPRALQLMRAEGQEASSPLASALLHRKHAAATLPHIEDESSSSSPLSTKLRERKWMHEQGLR